MATMMTVTLIYDLGNAVRRTSVQVPQGSTGLDVMNEAAFKDSEFRFVSSNYSRDGSPSAVAIFGLSNLYVPFQSGGFYLELLVGPDVNNLQPSGVGIGSLRPSPNSIIQWVIASSSSAEHQDQSKGNRSVKK